MNIDFMNGFSVGMSLKSVAFVTTDISPWTPKINIKDAQETATFIDLLFGIGISESLSLIPVSSWQPCILNNLNDLFETNNEIKDEYPNMESFSPIPISSWSGITLGSLSESTTLIDI